MVEGYNQSAATLNLLRAFTKGGYADLTQVHLWNQEFVASSPEGRRYEQLASEIERALALHGACGIDLDDRARGCTRSTSARATRGCCSTTRRG